MPKSITKIDMNHISVMIDMCVELEKNLRGYILEILKMVKIAKMAIKWPKLKNGSFSLKKCFFHLLIVLHSLSPRNIFESRPRNINNISTSDECMKIMIWSKMAQKWSKWPKGAFINHHLG